MADTADGTSKPPSVKLTAWQITNRRLVLDRSPYVQVYDEDVRLPDGKVITNWAQIEVAPFVIIFALLTDGRVPFVRQYRKSVNDFTLELPAGIIDPGEDTLTAAKRELREEAGVEADSWQFMGKYVMDANRGCGWANVFLAQEAQQVAPPNHGDLGDMIVDWLTIDEIRPILLSGGLVSAPTALSIGLALAAIAPNP